jgi:hypothetical protein
MHHWLGDPILSRERLVDVEIVIDCPRSLNAAALKGCLIVHHHPEDPWAGGRPRKPRPPKSTLRVQQPYMVVVEPRLGVRATIVCWYERFPAYAQPVEFGRIKKITLRMLYPAYLLTAGVYEARQRLFQFEPFDSLRLEQLDRLAHDPKLRVLANNPDWRLSGTRIWRTHYITPSAGIKSLVATLTECKRLIQRNAGSLRRAERRQRAWWRKCPRCVSTDQYQLARRRSLYWRTRRRYRR